ncbi:MAG: sugar transporter [Ruminococcaceae bacterium]|nr:sugar transporter [Oscillospiraceae bacterium]
MSEKGTNRAKFYQLALFPMNNGATNVYFVLILSYIATFGNKVLGLAMVFASFMVTGMRVFDAITDPIIGALMDKTNGKFGKFRPFMVLGNIVMAVSVILLYMVTPIIPKDAMWLRYTAFIALYAVWVLGYTFQTSVTRSAQPVLTNDPKQRPLFTVFNTIGSLVGMGVMQFVGPILAGDGFAGDYNASWFRIMTPIGVVVSILLTILAIVGIWEKDNEKYFGLGGKQEKVKVSEYISIIKANKPLQRLMVAGGGCKLALAIATNVTVLIMLYSCLMGNYDGLYLPMMVLGYVFSAPFFLLTVRTSQKHGQKRSLMTYVAVALICYVGVLALLLMWKQGNPAFNLTLMADGKLSINLYTILFILFFGVGYGAYYSTADMPIPMVADCADYETYRSGKFIPGIMGTLFSLVDKLVSSLSATVVSLALLFINVRDLPTKETAYVDGMNWVVIALFCIVPMVAWLLTLWAMKGYELDGKRVKTIQKVNAARKQAITDGMSLEEAMIAINDETINI